MNRNLFDLINTVKAVDVIVTTALFMLIGGILINQRKNIQCFLEGWRKKRNFEDTVMDSIRSLYERDEELHKEVKNLEEAMRGVNEKSKEIRDEMYDNISDISSDVKMLVDSINSMTEKEELSKRASIKSKIEKIYRECSESKLCTDTQLETLKDLIEDYERYGGHNSFVHSLVEKEMYTWDLIEKIPSTK